jgi:hypothetical protein
MSILNWLSRSEAPRTPESDAAARVRNAIELAVLGVDARLRLVKGYANQLLPAVENALAHCSALAASIPGPIDLLPDAWTREPGVRALFVQSAEIDELLGRSLELLAFAQQPAHAGVEQVCAVISLMRTEQKVLGWASHGEILHKDVAQRTVSFSRHRLLAPSASEDDLRREVEWRAYEHLVVEALGVLFRAEAAEPPTGRASALLRERLQLLQRARAGLEALHQPPVADESAFHAMRQQLVENGRQLAALHRRANSLEERLERVVEALSRPEDVLAFGKIEDRLTSLNVVASDATDVAAELCLAEISVKGAQTYARTTAIVRLSRDQLKPRRMDFSAAERWL